MENIGEYWRILEITGDYWRLLENNGGANGKHNCTMRRACYPESSAAKKRMPRSEFSWHGDQRVHGGGVARATELSN